MHRNLHDDRSLDAVVTDQQALDRARRRRDLLAEIALAEGASSREVLRTAGRRTTQGAVAVGTAGVLMAPGMTGVAAAAEGSAPAGPTAVVVEVVDDGAVAAAEAGRAVGQQDQQTSAQPAPQTQGGAAGTAATGTAGQAAGEVEDGAPDVVESGSVADDAGQDAVDDAAEGSAAGDPADTDVDVAEGAEDGAGAAVDAVDDEAVGDAIDADVDAAEAVEDGTGAAADDEAVGDAIDAVVDGVVGEDVEQGHGPAAGLPQPAQDAIGQLPDAAEDAVADVVDEAEDGADDVADVVADDVADEIDAGADVVEEVEAPVAEDVAAEDVAAEDVAAEDVVGAGAGHTPPGPPARPSHPTGGPAAHTPAPRPPVVPQPAALPVAPPAAVQVPVVGEVIDEPAPPARVDPVTTPQRPSATPLTLSGDVVHAVDPASSPNLRPAPRLVQSQVTEEDRILKAQSRPVDAARVDDWSTAVRAAWSSLQAGAAEGTGSVIARDDVAALPTLGWSYQVEPGDSLWTISEALWGVDTLTSSQVEATWQLIYTWNAHRLGADPHTIPTGTVIQIPIDAGA